MVVVGSIVTDLSSVMLQIWTYGYLIIIRHFAKIGCAFGCIMVVIAQRDLADELREPGLDALLYLGHLRRFARQDDSEELRGDVVPDDGPPAVAQHGYTPPDVQHRCALIIHEDEERECSKRYSSHHTIS